ncbi:hypothetical protein [Methanococcoides sp. AM1]|uniref:hypothetical protein n=1 Tax=Methanococcoides sp. AM1 TaxID=1201011 RepID=UPI001082E3EC|nr:hypothetical protein [Methanococcoides sp. AM1]
MKRTLLLIVLVLILISIDTASALVTKEADNLQYQVNHSDTIIVGKVVDRDIIGFTIEIEECLKNPQPTENITVTSFNGFGVPQDDVHFNMNETVILMLRKDTLDESMFRVVSESYGKHPVSNKDEIVKAIEFEKETNEEMASNEIPFIGLAGMSIAVSSAFLLLRKYD